MKQWQAPMLIVLARTHPAESVLTACKTLNIGTAPINVFPGCASLISAVCHGCEAPIDS